MCKSKERSKSTISFPENLVSKDLRLTGAGQPEAERSDEKQGCNRQGQNAKDQGLNLDYSEELVTVLKQGTDSSGFSGLYLEGNNSECKENRRSL